MIHIKIFVEMEIEGETRMYVIACVDDRNGLLFNNRRQSRDAKVIEKIQELTKNNKL